MLATDGPPSRSAGAHPTFLCLGGNFVFPTANSKAYDKAQAGSGDFMPANGFLPSRKPCCKCARYTGNNRDAATLRGVAEGFLQQPAKSLIHRQSACFGLRGANLRH
jgi:hypothetical protein